LGLLPIDSSLSSNEVNEVREKAHPLPLLPVFQAGVYRFRVTGVGGPQARRPIVGL
jgi:hypothetical protein